MPRRGHEPDIELVTTGRSSRKDRRKDRRRREERKERRRIEKENRSRGYWHKLLNALCFNIAGVPAEQPIPRKMGNCNSSPRTAGKDKMRQKKRRHRSKKRKSKKSKKGPGDYPILVRFFGFKGKMKRAHHCKPTHHNKKGKDAMLVFH
ncbi:uncharacterized protein J7T54_000199 [Emericellopsis cladophorae]|uniref:Uncharacterized protein n=1 Tax=Emericellopsis cladophorae TaxID=2686198 RepID=A0A9Q0BDU7_9HYPO|nr:uncharacterized protein J7T54_000199 [Emericellopsis cladophorae]KAI6780559.1 hypothetical protein J7T54_000199 [Emericellopsis cladophorae]